MKANQLNYNRISVQFFLTAVLFFPVICNAQVDLNISNNVGIGTTSQIQKLQVAGDINIETGGGVRINNTATSGQYLRGNGTKFVSSAIQAGDLPGGISGLANPAASIGLSAVNGTATTAMRSDGAPALNQAIAPTWTGTHTFNNGTYSALFTGGNVGIGTAAPGKKFDVNGDALIGASSRAAGHAFLFLDAGTAAANEPHFRFCQNTVLKAQIKWSSDFDGGIDFYTVGKGSFVRFTNLGKVGIGTTKPLSLLDVRTLGGTTSENNLITLGTKIDTSIKSRFAVNDGGTYDRSYNWSVNTNGILTVNKDVAGYAAAAIVMMPGASDGSANNCIDFQTTTAAGTTLISRLTVNQNGNVGIGTTTPTNKLEVVGSSLFTGSLSINGTGLINGANITSDHMFKTNVDSLHNALSIINQLKPRSFYLDTTNIYGLNFTNQKQYGFIAQDVEQVLPELISNTTKSATYDTTGGVLIPSITYKVLNYNAFTAIMMQGIKEQSSKIDSLSEGLLTEKTKTNSLDSIINSLQNQMNQSMTNNTLLQNQLNALASTINACCEDNHDNGNHNGYYKADNNQTNVELNDAQTIVLEQNVPNPFAEQTSINYSLPDNTVKAQMLFYNAQGKLIQSTELTQKGKGTLNVFASDLSNGIYTYTLAVDGKIIETKKMVKQ